MPPHRKWACDQLKRVAHHQYDATHSPLIGQRGKPSLGGSPSFRYGSRDEERTGGSPKFEHLEPGTVKMRARNIVGSRGGRATTDGRQRMEGYPTAYERHAGSTRDRCVKLRISVHLKDSPRQAKSVGPSHYFTYVAIFERWGTCASRRVDGSVVRRRTKGTGRAEPLKRRMTRVPHRSGVHAWSPHQR
jgi:hypothetical protein